MTGLRWLLLGLFVAALAFVCLLQERTISSLSYQRGALYEEVTHLENEHRDLAARLEKLVSPAKLEQMARKLRLAPESNR